MAVPSSSSGELATRFFDGIEAGDLQAVAGLYAPDAVIWHNHDRAESGVAENLALLAAFIAGTATRRYLNRRVHALPSGFAQQHDLHVAFCDGREATIPAAIFCSVEGGHITRLDEYLDSADLRAFALR